MVDERKTEESRVEGEGTAIPVANLAYFNQSSSLLPVVGATCVLGLVIGTIQVMQNLLHAYGFYKNFGFRWTTGAVGFPIAGIVLFVVIDLILSLCLMLGAAQGLRRPPGGRRILVVWAWSKLASGLVAVIFGATYVFQMYMPQMGWDTTISVLTGYVDRWLAGMLLPVVVLALYRRAEMNELFVD